MSIKKDAIDAEIVDEKESNKSKGNDNTSKDLKDFITRVESLPQGIKIILALPFLDIFWVVFRLLKSILRNDIIGIILAALLLAFGIPFLWLIDIICIAINNQVWWYDFRRIL